MKLILIYSSIAIFIYLCIAISLWKFNLKDWTQYQRDKLLSCTIITWMILSIPVLGYYLKH